MSQVPCRGAILAPYVFVSCLALTHIELPQDASHPSRSATESCTPDGCFNSCGLERLTLPSEWINMLPPDGEDSQTFTPIEFDEDLLTSQPQAGASVSVLLTGYAADSVQFFW